MTKYKISSGSVFGSLLTQSWCKSTTFPKKNPTTKLNKYSGTNFRRRRNSVATRQAWNKYVQVPSDSFGNTSEKAYGTLEMAEMPDPEWSISTTPKLLINTMTTRASSPRSVFRVDFIKRKPSFPRCFSFPILGICLPLVN